MKNSAKTYEALDISHAAHSHRKRYGKRASGMRYSNPPEKLQAIKEKYQNGVPAGEVERWILSNAQREILN